MSLSFDNYLKNSASENTNWKFMSMYCTKNENNEQMYPKIFLLNNCQTNENICLYI